MTHAVPALYETPDNRTIPYSINGLPQARPVNALSLSNLVAARFEHITLDTVSFNGSTLTNSNFTSCSLIHSRFVLAVLRQATFSDSILKHADLRSAELTGARFHGCNLARVNLSSAGGEDVELIGVDADQLNARYTSLKRLHAMTSRFIAADFTGSNLRDADFGSADLSYAVFVNADLRGVNFTGADLTGANFTGAIIDSDTCFTGAVLDGARKIDLRVGVESLPLQAALHAERTNRNELEYHLYRTHKPQQEEQIARKLIEKYELAGYFSDAADAGLLSEQLEDLLNDKTAAQHPEVAELFTALRQDLDALRQGNVLKEYDERKTAANNIATFNSRNLTAMNRAAG